MTEAQLRALNPALDRYLEQFLFCCGYTQTYEHLVSYCRGLLSDLDRKTCEPIALACGKAVRTMQEFLRDHDWSHVRLIDTLQGYAADLLVELPADELGTIGLIDETGTPKKGKSTPGVKRQWCGQLGKVDNCIVTVHLGVRKGRFKALLGGTLYLPEDWADDRERCRKAGIPETVLYRPKWQIAHEEIDRATGNGVVLDWLTFDEGYGKHPEFLAGLDERHRRFVGEVPRSLACRLVQGEQPPARQDDSAPAEVVLSAALAGRAVAVRIPRENLADEVWQAGELRVWLRQGKGWSERAYRLIVAYNDRTGEIKYFVSNAPESVPVALLLRVAFTRAAVEQCFEVQKGELGFCHYEGRNYRALHRHLALCCAVGLFAAQRAVVAQTKTVWATVKQVLRGLKVLCANWLRKQRGVGGMAAVAETIAYHQKRNEVAARSHKKRFDRPSFWIVPLSRMDYYPADLAPVAL